MNLPDLDDAKAYLNTLPIIAAYVFGSRVDGNPHPKSDLDIAIVPKKDVEIDYKYQAEIEHQLQQKISEVDVQLSVLRPKTSAILAVKVFRGIPIVVRDQFSKNLFEVNSYKRYRRQKHYMNIYTKYMVNRILEDTHAN